MENNIPLSDETFNKIMKGIDEGKYWLVHENNSLFLDHMDVRQYESKAEAIQAVAEATEQDKFRMLYAPTIQDALRQMPYGNSENIISSQKSSFMNQENLKFLQDRLFYLGTEKKLYPELEKNMAEGKPEFQLSFSNQYDKDKLTASLQFRKSENADMYFLNRYEATLQKPAQESKFQTFYLDNGRGITMKEAYNLLDGRSVNKDLKNKEGAPYNAWVKLDFENKDARGNAKLLQYHKNYGYDLNQELARLPLFPMAAEELKRVVTSLEKGNVQEVKVHGVEGRQSVYLAANPQFKTLNLFDKDMKPLNKEEKQSLLIVAEYQKAEAYKKDQHPGTVPQKEKVVPESTPEKTTQNEMESPKEVKKENPSLEKSVDKNQGYEKKTSKTTKQEKIESLLPKNRSGQKKGLSI